jgi:multiple sugar transport system permease protein
MPNPVSPVKRFLRRNATGFLFISPWLIGFIVFKLGPFLSSVYLSFNSYDVISPPHWVGIANYQTLAHDDPMFWHSLWVTVKYALCAVPLGIVAGVILALLLNADIPGQSLFRTLLYMPSIMPTVAASVVFMWLLNPEKGLVNEILGTVGIRGPAWLQDTTWALWSLVLMSLWGIGNSMIIYLAGLKDIPRYLYEAAVIDGANGLQRLKSITLPMLTPVIFFNLVMGVIYSFQFFTEAFVMTRGGPEQSTSTYAYYLFQRAWQFMDMGYACAMAWVVFLIVMIVTGLLFKFQGKWVHFGS